jgi:hypothetical protein
MHAFQQQACARTPQRTKGPGRSPPLPPEPACPGRGAEEEQHDGRVDEGHRLPGQQWVARRRRGVRMQQQRGDEGGSDCSMGQCMLPAVVLTTARRPTQRWCEHTALKCDIASQESAGRQDSP